MRRLPRRLRGFRKGRPTQSFWKSLFMTLFSLGDWRTWSMIQTQLATHRVIQYQFARFLCLASETMRRECMTWQAAMGVNIIWRRYRRWELQREPWQAGIFAAGLMACGTTGYLQQKVVTANIATTNSTMNMMKSIGHTWEKPCTRIDRESSDVWYAMLTFVQHVTMNFMVQTCLHTPE